MTANSLAWEHFPDPSVAWEGKVGGDHFPPRGTNDVVIAVPVIGFPRAGTADGKGTVDSHFPL